MTLDVAKKITNLSTAGHAAYAADIADEVKTDPATPKTKAKLLAGFYDRL